MSRMRPRVRQWVSGGLLVAAAVCGLWLGASLRPTATPVQAAPPRGTLAGSGEPSHGGVSAPACPKPPDVWTVPARYRGKIVRQRVRHFPNRIVALTFDDGPDPVITPQVLATLKRHHSRATFFVLGRNAKRYPQLVKQAAAAGHAIGSHGYTHPQSCTPAQAQSELQRSAAIIRQATGHTPTIFRPPYGITSGNLCRQAQASGYAAILWTISSADTRPINAATIANNVIHTPNPGDFVLMHDGAGHKATAQALEQILTELTAAGFQFVTIPELLSAWDRWQARQAKPPVPAKSRP